MIKSGILRKVVIYSVVAAEILLASYIFAFAYLCQDHAEHLHASWLVWQGEVPYRDFFEHHNPLLWFVLAPITAFFYLNPYIIYISRVLSALIYMTMFYGLYTLSRKFLKLHQMSFYLMLMLFFSNKTNILSFFELTPDSFMDATFVWGFYFYCQFLKEKKQNALNLSFLLFCISFLFLQKVLILLIVLGFHILYLLYKKEIHFGEIFKACLAPVVLCCCFLWYLYYTSALSTYFIFNYDLNTIVPKFMGNARINQDFFMVFFFPLLATILLHHFLKTGNRYRNLLAGVVFCEYVIKMNVWAPWIQYFLLTNIVCMLVVSQSIIDFIKFKRGKLLLTIIILAQLCGLYKDKLVIAYVPYFRLHQYIMKNTDKNDIIINGAMLFFNIYGKNADYYWFGYQNITPIAYYLYGYNDKPDINQMLYRYKPKFFYNAPYINMIALSNTKNDFAKYLAEIYPHVYNHQEGAESFSQHWSNPLNYEVDEKFLRENYVYAKYYQLLIRKDFRYWLFD